MYIIIWKYKVKPEHREQFIEYYKSDGEWVKFFQQDANYIGTDFLFGDEKNEFLTIDSWISERAFRQFKEVHASQYNEIDSQCEAFTETEIFLGNFSD
jgi:hypothetical protein